MRTLLGSEKTDNLSQRPFRLSKLAKNWKAQTVIENPEGQRCVRPVLDLWNPDLRSLFSEPDPLKCEEEQENWVYSENGVFHISESAKRKHGNIVCDYAPITLRNDTDLIPGTAVRPYPDKKKIMSDFFLVRCVSSKGAVYKNIHSGIARKDSAVNVAKSKQRPEKALGFNILMFGFDSLSRLNWIRNLPKAHEYFTKELQGVVLEGYNIIGDGTPQALLPILTGHTEEELPESRRGFPNARRVDGHPWIWKDFKKLGYMTQWGEDGASFGTFNMRMLGFGQQPVDHYMRPFYLMAEKNFYSINKPFCLGSLPRHKNMLNWVKDFFNVYSDVPKFSFLFHSEYSHDQFSSIRLADEDLRSFLAELNSDNILNNTLLVLMADHGARFQQVRESEQGKYEERMPYFAFRFPPWFFKKYPQAERNLRANAQRITTPFDVHATLREIMNFSGVGSGSRVDRGISLLKEIPAERTCADASIEPHWCTCLDWVEVSFKDRHVIGSAEALLSSINSITSENRDVCDQLSLKRIIAAAKYYPSEQILKFKGSSDVHGRVPDFTDNMAAADELYQVTIETSPGGAKFEATVKRTFQTKSSRLYLVNEREISRINKYGKQPYCIMDKLPHLRPYCHCSIQLSSTVAAD